MKAKIIVGAAFTVVNYGLIATGAGTAAFFIIAGVEKVTSGKAPAALGPEEKGGNLTMTVVNDGSYVAGKTQLKMTIKHKAEHAAAHVAKFPLISQNVNRVLQSATNSSLLRNAAQAALNDGGHHLAKVAGKGVGAGGVSLFFLSKDAAAYAKRDFQTDNPYEAAMQQAEGGIRNLNQDIAALKAELSAAVALRNSELKKARTAYCYDSKSKKIDDPVQCGTGVGEAPGA